METNVAWKETVTKIVTVLGVGLFLLLVLLNAGNVRMSGGKSILLIEGEPYQELAYYNPNSSSKSHSILLNESGMGVIIGRFIPGDSRLFYDPDECDWSSWLSCHTEISFSSEAPHDDRYWIVHVWRITGDAL